jgi:methylaspartate mutase sigma subunit
LPPGAPETAAARIYGEIRKEVPGTPEFLSSLSSDDVDEANMKPVEWADRPRSGSLDVVVTGLPSDAHTWNLVFIQMLLEDLGHKVVNLGPCVPQDEIVESCCKSEPDLLVISSVNGHGYNDARPLIEAVRSRWELADLPVVIGGKLGIAGQEREWTGELMRAGFDAVFQDGTGLDPFTSYVGSLAVAR